ncbi:MFS transporter [Peribacillus alkalitolerans]|uniref:MFS transporter n=1 Tax=Peribacillus alkalitolerans TaxID=1550385 RepID=UPI0013D6975B|nr:MFS transporter [Peribacillus alkalitolerans]
MKLFNWKLASLMLTGIGISTLGDFIYLIAINLLVYQMTHSAAAVAGLWIVGPIISVLTNSWSGGFIDRSNKKKIMITTDIIRTILVALIPFMTNVWGIYSLLCLISVAKSFFSPASTTYIATLVPVEKRKKYNSISGLVTSGAFIVGPAIAGGLFLMGSIEFAIFANAASFLISAMIILLLPNVNPESHENSNKSRYATLKDDWKEVISFGRKEYFVMAVYSCFLTFGLFSLAMDSQEVVFVQQVVGLTEADYSFLVSITGVGFAVGAFITAFLSKHLSLRTLMGLGMLLVSIGYLIYSLSNSFLTIVVGFTILGLFNAFMNTGFSTFYQNNIPLHLMGRVSSVVSVAQSGLQIFLLLLVGFLGDVFPLRYTIVLLAALNVLFSLFVLYLVARPGKQICFSETTKESITG